MKREYIQPHTEAVVVKCNEKLMWGGLAIESQGQDHTNAKTGFFDEEDDDLKSSDLWDDNDSFGE